MNFSRLTEYLDGLENKYGVPGFDIRICRDHEEIYRHMGGHSDHAKTVPVGGNELYNIYSASKVITMTAAMQLIEKGILGLDDPVAEYLPEFRQMQVADHFDFGVYPPVIPTMDDPHHPAKTPITIRMLMSMTAGLNYDVESAPIRELREATGGKATTRQMMGAIAKMPLLYEPGTRYLYSLGHDVIAGVIEVVSGMTFGEYLKKNIFDPLQLTDMYLLPDAAQISRLNAQFINEPDSEKIVPTKLVNRYRLSDCYESGGAGISCSVKDYSTFIDALACGGVGWNGERVLTPEGIRQLSENQLSPEILPDFQSPWQKAYGYALGVRTLIHPELSPTPLGEFGWDGAAGAYALIDPVNHISVFYVQEVLNMVRVYAEIHPAVRNLIYAGLKE